MYAQEDGWKHNACGGPQDGRWKNKNTPNTDSINVTVTDLEGRSDTAHLRRTLASSDRTQQRTNWPTWYPVSGWSVYESSRSVKCASPTLWHGSWTCRPRVFTTPMTRAGTTTPGRNSGSRSTVNDNVIKKVAHTRLLSVGLRSLSRFMAVSLQVTWIINPAVGCHYLPPGLHLPLQPLRGLLPICCLVNRGTMGVNSLPKTATWQHRDCDLNPNPSAPESSTLTTQLPSHPTSQRTTKIATSNKITETYIKQFNYFYTHTAKYQCHTRTPV